MESYHVLSYDKLSKLGQIKRKHFAGKGNALPPASPNNCNACLLLILHILGLYYIYRRTSPSSYLSSPSYIVRIGRSLASSLAASMAGGGFSRPDSIADMMPEALRQSRYHMKRCFQRYVARGSRLMKRQQLLEELHADDDVAQQGFLGYVISSTHEAVVLPPHVNLAVRTNPGIWEYIKVHSADLSAEQITPSQYLKCKEILITHHDHDHDGDELLEVDFGALDDLSTPRLTLPSSIGNGMHLVSRFMSSKLAAPGGMEPLLQYLLALTHRGHNLMVNGTVIDTVSKLQTAARRTKGLSTGFRSGGWTEAGAPPPRRAERPSPTSPRCCRHRTPPTWPGSSAGCRRSSTSSSFPSMDTSGRTRSWGCQTPAARSSTSWTKSGPSKTSSSEGSSNRASSSISRLGFLWYLLCIYIPS